jgi:hypothetical protein
VLRIWDVYPGSWLLHIPYPGSKNSNKREGWKKISCHTFFVDINFTKWKLFYFWNAEEKNLGQFSKNYRTFYPKKLSLSSQKYGLEIRDSGSGIRKKTYSGSRGQKGTGFRIRIRNTVKKRNLPEVFDVCLVSPSHQVISDLLIVALIDVCCRHSHNLRPLRRVLKSNLSLHR